MKIMTPDAKSWDNVVQKTRTEFDLVKELNIKSIVKYIEFNEDAIWTNSKGKQLRCCYLVMENLKAAEMLEFINEMGSQSDQFIRYMFIEIASAIH